MNEVIGNNIRDARLRLGMSQMALAKAMETQGVTWLQTMITRVERGERLIRVDELPAVLTVLGDVLTGTPLAEFRGDAARREQALVDSLTDLIDAASGLRDQIDQPKESK